MPATIPPILSRRRRDLTKPYQAKGRARNPTFVQYKNLIGTRVFKKLLGMDIQFKCEFARLIHEFGRKTRFQKHQILAAENLYGWIIEGREAKKRFLFPGRRTYHCEPENWVKIRYSLPQGTPVSRLVKLRLKREQSLLDGVKKLFSDELNAARIGEAKIVRAPADAPWDAATASASMQRKFPVPYSNYWKWPQTYANINVTIPANYEQVITANLEVVDGLITLAVQGQPGNPGEKVWKARWARKARGFSFVVEDDRGNARGRGTRVRRPRIDGKHASHASAGSPDWRPRNRGHDFAAPSPARRPP